MESKKPPIIDKIPISTFFIHRERYKIDPTYQREAGTWSKSDEQFLIDTILRGFSMPPIFLHKNDKVEWIVDGQQRLNTIWSFKDGAIKLNEEHSEDIIKENNGKKTYIDLIPEFQNIFDAYPIPIIYLENYNDEEIRNMFRRLQRGKKLTVGEILNAFEGNIVLAMRELSQNNFFKKCVAIRRKRYKHFHISAIFLYLQKVGIKDISPRYLYSFFENNKNLSMNSKEYGKINRILNYLNKVLEGKKTKELRKNSWIVTLYLLCSHLIDNYVMNKQEENLRKFFLDFYQKIKKAPISKEEELIKFNLAISKGTGSETNIKFRYKVILKRFLNSVNLNELDENRLFDEEQKIKIFRRDEGKCKECKKELEMGNPETHYHHTKMWSKGGRTLVDDGLLVCRNCHLNVIHGKEKISV